MRQLKKWNGRAQGRLNGSFYVAAYTQKQAAHLIAAASGQFGMASISEIRKYYSPCWGRPMDGINPTEPCVYHSNNYETPIKIYPNNKKSKKS